MRHKLVRGVLAVAGAVTAAAAMYASTVWATPGNASFTASTLAVGTFLDDVEVANQVLRNPDGPDLRPELWLSMQRTKGKSQLYVQSNVWKAQGQEIGTDGQPVPAGSTGWHTHPGHSLIIVTAGTVTAYEGDCTAKDYHAGQAFVDPGGDHAHLLRNNGAVEARTIAVQLIPSGATRRIDVAAPAGCNVE